MTSENGNGDVPESDWVVRHEGNALRIGEEPLLIGRSARCHIVLEGDNVSRHHARLWAAQDVVFVEDLGSTNGVIVDSTKIERKTIVPDGAQIIIGKFTLEVGREAKHERGRVTTLRKTAIGEAVEIREKDEREQTLREDTLELMGSVARKALAIGKVQQAEETLRPLLQSVRDTAQRQGLPRKTWKTAVRLAGDLAKASMKAEWIDYVFDISRHDPHPLPVEFVDLAIALVPKIGSVDLGLVRTYVAAMNRRSGELNPKLMIQITELERRAAAVK